MVVGSMCRPKSYLAEADGGGESAFLFSKAKMKPSWRLIMLPGGIWQSCVLFAFGKPKLYGPVKAKVEGERLGKKGYILI